MGSEPCKTCEEFSNKVVTPCKLLPAFKLSWLENRGPVQSLCTWPAGKEHFSRGPVQRPTVLQYKGSAQKASFPAGPHAHFLLQRSESERRLSTRTRHGASDVGSGDDVIKADDCGRARWVMCSGQRHRSWRRWATTARHSSKTATLAVSLSRPLCRLLPITCSRSRKARHRQ